MSQVRSVASESPRPTTRSTQASPATGQAIRKEPSRFAALLQERELHLHDSRRGARVAGQISADPQEPLQTLRRPDGRSAGDPSAALDRESAQTCTLERDRAGAGSREAAGPEGAAFVVPPPVLLGPPSGANPIGASVGPPPTGIALAHAEAAARAERIVTQMRVGRVGRHGHEVHMRIDLGRGGSLAVRLRAERGTLRAELDARDADGERTGRIATTLASELRARGLDVEAIDVVG
ncbi:MAG: hypothetical protein NZ898_10935 [Myxococcota bacterium]|nr:hypothetical protein [Myxococcota bacterium]